MPMKAIHRLIALLCFLIVVVLLASAVAAQEEPSLTLHYEPLCCAFRFYRVADFSESGGLTLSDRFLPYRDSATYLSDLNALDAEEARSLSFTLEAIVARDALPPDYALETDSKGYLKLENPTKGFYLVLGDQVRDDRYIYTPSPMLVSVPNQQEGSAWNDQVVVEHHKLQKEELKEEKVDYRVMKIWKGADQNRRPPSLTVRLLRDGVSYDTVTLRAENNWQYQWKDLPAGHVWTAVEVDVPRAYSMKLEKDAAGVVIQNTYTGETPPPPALPPTGQLWWPVPLLLLFGAAAILAGLSFR